MINRVRLSAGIAPLLAGLLAATNSLAGERVIPHPLPAHPGNIFLKGEEVTVPLPPGGDGNWRATDYEKRTVAEGPPQNGRARLGKLPVGYYEVTPPGDSGSNLIYIGVLEPLHAPTPMDSPIGIDVALAWCFPKEQWENAISLTQLAGMNRVRDRMSWPEVEPQRGEFAAKTRYDDSLKIQTESGLQVLEVNHVAPPWANPNGKRFPLDLRDAYNAYRDLARRWKGNIVAFEPWNEADIIEFGGHTGDEMASMQKASYLGLKAGDPQLPVCQNVFAIHRQTTLRNFKDNEAGPYFDMFDVHHYQKLAEYPRVYADYREASAGKPIWTTECNVTVNWSGDEQRKEPDEENLRIQSQRVAKIYSECVYEGSQSVFYFMLPHYSERKLQYGVLHPDLSPRPAYLAVAASGRLLADAKRLGQVETNNGVHGFLFDAKPDGKEADVLVIWADEEAEFELPRPPAACFDHLGRGRIVAGQTLKLTHAPLFAILAKDSRPPLVAPPKLAPLVSGKPGTIVLQALLPEKDIVLVKSSYKMPVGPTNAVPIYIYNFGATKAHGRMKVTAPEEWTAEFPKEVDIAPGERKELTLKLATDKNWAMAARIRIDGNFGKAGKSVLALRFVSSTE